MKPGSFTTESKNGYLLRFADYRSKGLGFESLTRRNLTQSEESRQLSVIPGMGITKCGHIKEKPNIGKEKKLPAL